MSAHLDANNARILADACAGVVSKAVLEAGGYAHGITPRALMQRASERTATPGSAPNGDAKDVKSKEGQGDDLLDEEYGGRLTMEVTGSMHDASDLSSNCYCLSLTMCSGN